MFRTISFLFSLFVYSVSILSVTGCLPDFPKVGTRIEQSDTTNSTPDLKDTVTILVDTLPPTNTATGDTSQTDSGPSTDSTNPSIDLFRPCTHDQECINSEGAGTYHCSDGGLCVSDSKSCTKNSDCRDASVCNGVETCWYGSCYLGRPLICDDGDLMTNQACNPSTGCIYWNINECSRDEQCRPGFQCDFDARRCVQIISCITDSECGDQNACTADRCLEGVCDYVPVACYDENPNTMDTCNPEIGCEHREGCVTDRDCADRDIHTTDKCIAGKCVFTLTYAHLSVFSSLPEQQGDRVDYHIEMNPGHLSVAMDALPSQLYFPEKVICEHGIYIDIYDPDDWCDQYYPLYGIDVWRELTLLNHILVPDECGERIYVSPENLGCDTAMP